MKKKIGSVLLSVFLLTACESIDEEAISKKNLNGEGYHILFFSNEDYINLEENYYDVLLDLRKTYPKKMANLYLVQSSKKSNVKKYKVDTYPTLIIIKDGKVLTRIEGKKTKKEILQNVTSVIN